MIRELPPSFTGMRVRDALFVLLSYICIFINGTNGGKKIVINKINILDHARELT